jgi:hypothetical protein
MGKIENWNPWPESASELYRPSDHRFSAKLVPALADSGCCVVSRTDPYGRILAFLEPLLFFQVHPQLYSRGLVGPLLLRKYGSAGNRIQTSGSVAKNYNHQTREKQTLINAILRNKCGRVLSYFLFTPISKEVACRKVLPTEMGEYLANTCTHSWSHFDCGWCSNFTKAEEHIYGCWSKLLGQKL